MLREIKKEGKFLPWKREVRRDLFEGFRQDYENQIPKNPFGGRSFIQTSKRR
jgi:hypothetical protein